MIFQFAVIVLHTIEAVFSPQCLDTVGWVTGRAFGL